MFKLFENGAHFVGRSANPPLKRAKRGKVTSFSSKSSRNLRDYCCRLRIGDKIPFAVTLTTPSLYDSIFLRWFLFFCFGFFCEKVYFDITPIWDKLLKRYRENLRRCRIGAIWRIELQRRGTPHLHLISAGGLETGFELWKCWIDALSLIPDIDYKSLVSRPGVLEYSVRVRVVRDRFRWLPYLIGHHTKHKSSQLGWQGRQWGIFNRQFLNFADIDESISLGCSERTTQLVLRTLRRHFSRRLPQARHAGTSVLNINPQIISRLVDFFDSCDTPLD